MILRMREDRNLWNRWVKNNHRRETSKSPVENIEVKGIVDMEELFQVKGNILTIRIPEELDHHSAEAIREGSERILENQTIRQIIFDFRRTQFMDSSGIGMLMGRYRSMNQMGGSVVAVHVKERVAKILQLSGIYKVIPVEPEKSWT